MELQRLTIFVFLGYYYVTRTINGDFRLLLGNSDVFYNVYSVTRPMLKEAFSTPRYIRGPRH